LLASTDDQFERREDLVLAFAAARTRVGLIAVLFALAYLWLLRQAWHGRARLGLAACLLLCASPYLVPWYAVWAIPVAAVEDDPPAQWLAVAISAYLLRQRVPI